MGTIKIFAFSFAPRDWALCNGQLISISQNTALFSLIGTTYGGNGQSTFALPDLRGRTMVGVGQGTGLPVIDWGEVGGTESNTLNNTTMPQHIHGIIPSDVAVKVNVITGGTITNEADNGGNSFSSGGSTANIYSEPGGSTTISKVAGVTNTVSGSSSFIGGNIPFSIRSPYLAMNHCILLYGIFPSRN